MRKHLTTFLWFEDKLCSLSAGRLATLSLACCAMTILLVLQALDFLDDLAFLLAENDAISFIAVLALLLMSSAALWLFFLTAVHLAQNLVLRGRERWRPRRFVFSRRR
jgi:hypothetical protein